MSSLAVVLQQCHRVANGILCQFDHICVQCSLVAPVSQVLFPNDDPIAKCLPSNPNVQSSSNVWRSFPKIPKIFRSQNPLHPKHIQNFIILDGGYLQETHSHFLTLSATKWMTQLDNLSGRGVLHDKGRLSSRTNESKQPKSVVSNLQQES